MKKISIIGCLLAGLSLSSCAVIVQDEIGIKRRLGRMQPQVIPSGVRLINPFTTTVIRLPARTVNLEVTADLPSREGLTINTEISILYHIKTEKAHDILRDAGEGYVRTLILPVFRSAVADVSARFYAKDMHSSKRAEIEQAVKDQMASQLEARGFVIEAVLMKTVKLPSGLTRAIEEKLQAEQDAQRMEFILARERMEADRLKIQAQGISDYQKVIGQGLNPLILQYMSIEAFRELSKSGNSKVIITDGKSPILMNTNER
jgi:regulator of protease activity HflC (stomatin/prohibitin superfamily)